MVQIATVLEVIKEQKGLRLVFSGRLDAKSVAGVWGQALDAVRQGGHISIDASEVEYCDGAGIALLWELQGRGVEEISGLKPEIATLLEPFEDAKRKDGEQVRQKESALESGW